MSLRDNRWKQRRETCSRGAFARRARRSRPTFQTLACPANVRGRSRNRRGRKYPAKYLAGDFWRDRPNFNIQAPGLKRWSSTWTVAGLGGMGLPLAALSVVPPGRIIFVAITRHWRVWLMSDVAPRQQVETKTGNVLARGVRPARPEVAPYLPDTGVSG